jgi:NAD(P)-dependent dehydrogenase (short-subunit alcohol dehydrogenase family)
MKKIWFITGISSGLGKAIANEVMQRGDFVIGTFRHEDQVTQFNQENQHKGKAYLMDVTHTTTIQNVVFQVKQEFNQIDVLVNNAGFGFAGAIEETSEEEARNVFEANFFGTLFLTQAIVPLMRAQQSGRIIQISSHGGFKGFAGFGIYNASKFALEGFSEALAQEVLPFNIRLTIVQPGPFRTNFAGNNFGLAQTEIEDYASTSGVFRQRIKGVHGLQEGDPTKAAVAIYELVNHPNPPLRLPLGKIALTTIQSKIENVQQDLDNGSKIASNVVF